jgi:hypothetical protein
MRLGMSLEREAALYGFKGVDFDGTLARDDRYENGKPIPIMPMVERVRKWLADGDDVIIFTARGWQKEVEDFCIQYFGKPLQITNVKLRGLSAWYDDRAIAVEPNTGKILNDEGLAEENMMLRYRLEDVEGRYRKLEKLVAKLKKERV